MISEENFGIYIHFPFCRRKCLYCDFYSVGESMADWEAFAIAVESEYRNGSKLIPENSIVSLYMGGGTPSLAPLEVIKRFREMIRFAVGEFTIEVNPDDVTPEKARGWKEAGVNRVSMGVQSLNDEELRTIGRRHTSSDVFRAYSILREYFDNISLDLIFGLPGQSLGSLVETIAGFIELRPEHISAYSLMYEERSALTRLRDKGKITEVAEEDSVEMFRLLTSKLREAGYERYEISNYALAGYRSHHNSNYWQGIPYIGLGPSAHSYDGKNERRYNRADLSLYIKNQGRSIEGAEIEILSENELREEMIMTRLRTCEGLDLIQFQDCFGEKERKKLEKKAMRYVRSGHLIRSENAITLSDAGVMISDEIIADLF
ncbi:MAG: radical SAM family heme chaperone HemW [Muribaculaceae bacterium]|nr:radical SAM family heme chaperone HemW [Muribaculaceae bacterium]